MGVATHVTEQSWITFKIDYFVTKKYENSHPNGTQSKEAGIVCKFQLEFAKYLQLVQDQGTPKIIKQRLST